ncbi:MAG: DUF2169 domain-containing protein [Thiohalocapsa sp. PB-PSB1]|nr:MAG: DUF2169 domain-containing protein [Thiohalocapsa sp. PB-PSB1]
MRDMNGAEVWLVAVKCTFDIGSNGHLTIAQKQEPVILAPVFAGDPRTSSLLMDTDLPHRKAATDVLIFGYAHAPEAKPALAVDVELRVADLRKRLRVIGDHLSIVSWVSCISLYFVYFGCVLRVSCTSTLASASLASFAGSPASGLLRLAASMDGEGPLAGEAPWPLCALCVSAVNPYILRRHHPPRTSARISWR